MFEKPRIIKTDKPLLPAHLKVPRFHRNVVLFPTMYAGCDVRFYGITVRPKRQIFYFVTKVDQDYVYVYLQMCKTTLGRLGNSAMIRISDLNVNDDCNW